MCQHRIYEKLNYLPSSDTLVLQCLRCDMKIRVKMIRPQPEFVHSSKTEEVANVPDIKILKMLKALDNPIRLEIVNFILSQKGTNHENAS